MANSTPSTLKKKIIVEKFWFQNNGPRNNVSMKMELLFFSVISTGRLEILTNTQNCSGASLFMPTLTNQCRNDLLFN